MSSTTNLKNCPRCGGTEIEILGKARVWRGTGGYSDPQYFELVHYCLNHPDSFENIYTKIRARTEEQAIAQWNRRAP